MSHRRLVALTIGLACVLSVVAAAARATVDPATRTVDVGAFRVQFDSSDPEEITSLSWNGSPNLTNTWVHPFCPDGGASEFFGNSWDTSSDINFRAPVGWGSSGSWSPLGPTGAVIESSAANCFGTSGIPVSTIYRFFDRGAAANRILVTRRFSFRTPFAFDLRAYIPRLYPRDQYGLVIHPDANGQHLATEIGNDCEFGCEVTNWDGTWFAIHGPLSGRGMIVKREFSTQPVALWVDMDGGSQTAASSVLLLAPPGGFVRTVAETESLCFYDSTIWKPSLSLPPSC